MNLTVVYFFLVWGSNPIIVNKIQQYYWRIKLRFSSDPTLLIGGPSLINDSQPDSAREIPSLIIQPPNETTSLLHHNQYYNNFMIRNSGSFEIKHSKSEGISFADDRNRDGTQVISTTPTLRTSHSTHHVTFQQILRKDLISSFLAGIKETVRTHSSISRQID